jgi:hypothetical protein
MDCLQMALYHELCRDKYRPMAKNTVGLSLLSEMEPLFKFFLYSIFLARLNQSVHNYWFMYYICDNALDDNCGSE